MNKILSLLILFLLSFQQTVAKEASSFSDVLFNRIYLASKFVTELTDSLNHSAIVKPPNTWVTLARFEVGDKKYCLTYKVPYDNLGTIELRQSGGACDHFNGMLIHKLTDVQDVMIFFKEVENRHIALGSGDAFTFYLLYEKDKQKMRIEVPLLEIKGAREFKRYSNVARSSFLRGASFRKDPRTIFKDISGKYVDEKSVLCHKVSKGCVDTGPNECDKCPNGWYEVVDYNCKQGGTKFCAPSYCGDKGEPACLRGFEFTGTDRDDLCIADSPAGYCRPGLKTYCDENKILVCL